MNIRIEAEAEIENRPRRGDRKPDRDQLQNRHRPDQQRHDLGAREPKMPVRRADCGRVRHFSLRAGWLAYDRNKAALMLPELVKAVFSPNLSSRGLLSCRATIY